MKSAEIRKMSVPDLKKELLSLLRVQFGLKMQHATQQLANSNQLKSIRKDIARVKTIMTEKKADI